MNAEEIKQLIDRAYQRQMAVPKKLKINEEFLNKLIDNDIVNFESGMGLTRYNGIPVEIDNTIATFEFVYK